MKKISTTCLAEIAIMATLALALDFLQGGLFKGVFVNGGSIGFAMLPILVLTYRRGFIPGLISAFILSFLQMLGGIYAIADSWYMVLLQIMLDYIVAYPLVAFAGIFFKAFKNSTTQNNKIKYLWLGTIVGGLLKLLSHYLAGVIFWSSSTPEGFVGGAYLYSLVYNGGFMIPNIILCGLALTLMFIKAPQLFEIQDRKEKISNE